MSIANYCSDNAHKRRRIMATIATLTTKDIHNGMSLHVRVSRSYTIRTKVAMWLIGMAGRVMDMPCEIEIKRDEQ